jgi:protein-S-isoprenylcysteine O-methyltransferase Ste14
LITGGIYGVIRHPMCASQWLWVLAQLLLLQNWTARWLNLLVFGFFHFRPLRAQEQLMIERFGAPYGTGVQKVGAVFPGF